MDYTVEQKQIVDFLRKQIDNPEGQNVIVSGLAGVGKTWMMCSFICDLLVEGYNVVVAAITGKATGVIRNKLHQMMEERGLIISKNRYAVKTLTSLTKTSKVISLNEEGETRFFNEWNDPSELQEDYDVLFIDELSMVPHYIMKWCQKTELRIFGFGDFCQLPEVQSEQNYTEMRQLEKDLQLPKDNYIVGYGVKALKGLAKVHMKHVLRSDNDIANLCKELRDFTISKEAVVETMKKWAEKSPDIEYSDRASDIETDFDWQIIAYTNKKCQEVNNKLAIGTDYPNPEDKIILFDNVNSLDLYNGDVIKFKDFFEKTKEAIMAVQTADEYLTKRTEIIVMKWQGQIPSIKSSNPFERQYAYMFNTAMRQMESLRTKRTTKLNDLIKELDIGTEAERQKIQEKWAKFQLIDGNEDTKFEDLLDWLNKHELFHFEKKIAEAATMVPKLTVVNADFGFCCTTHRSQGSEYDKVCYLFERFDRALLYTGLSRAKKKLKIINLTSTI